jgi:three-Cys-motif partner protein
MAKDDQKHFDTYTPQNRIKHEILGKYFNAYMNALARTAQAYHYIDGFAGPGLYEEKHQGSPLIALDLLARQKLPCTASFTEKDPTLFDRLSRAIAGHQATTMLRDGPLLRQGEFSDFIDEILSRSIYKTFSRVATFAFIDPCGIKGARMADISRLVSQRFGECLIFWNYDGINRWLGGIAKGTHDRAGIIELFGDEATADAALVCFNDAKANKEILIRDLYLAAAKAHSGAKYLLPFRFEAKDRDRTSHYLVHCSGDGLAFKIMKAVMDGAKSGDEVGMFEFLNAGETNFQMGIFRPHFDDARTQVLARLAQGSCAVNVFTDEWVRRPTDLVSPEGYKQILLELEVAGEIQVFDKTGMLVPTEKRRKRNGKPTLGEGYYVRRSPTHGA